MPMRSRDRIPPRGTAGPRAEWVDGAECAEPGRDPNLWHSEDDRELMAAKRICAACPAAVACLDHAIRTGETLGVWGGLTAGQRKAARRQGLEPAEAVRAFALARPPNNGGRRRAA